MELVVPIMLESLRKYNIMKSLQAMGLEKSSLKFAPFHSLGCLRSPDSDLRKKLFDFGLRLQVVCGDGNCFFTSIAHNMLSNCKMWEYCLINLVGVPGAKLGLEELSHKLREVYVRELLGDRRVQYEAFVAHTDLDYEEEANRFKESKYFNSDLGDTMPLALATALQCPVVILHNNNDIPTMYVSPDIVTTDATAFVVYTSHNGLGHYNAAISCQRSATVTDDDKPNRCNCGINKRNTNDSCSPNALYMTRCRCFKLGKPCTHQCRCVNCRNPNGARIPVKKSIDGRVKRKHAFQVDIPQSKKFAQERGEETSHGIWSNFESIVLEQVCLKCKEGCEDMTKLYNDIVYYSQTSYCVVRLPPCAVFREKNERQIRSKRGI